MRGGRKSSRGKTNVSTSPDGSTDFGSYFVDIGFDVKEPMVEAPPPPKKRKLGLRKEWLINSPRPKSSLQTWQCHVVLGNGKTF